MIDRNSNLVRPFVEVLGVERGAHPKGHAWAEKHAVRESSDSTVVNSSLIRDVLALGFEM